MRINRLDLTRYGRFTDAIIDFGSRPVGSPDLHIIYGPNEAGKSTTLDAILDLIFGIGNTSRYGFLHPYNAMRLGANVQVAGQAREFVRIKRAQNSLLAGDERSLADAEIRADLGGIDRDAFSTMFSLDDTTLEKGGENILASRGDLGELLFSASAGLSDLSRHLVAIRADADSFYKFRGRSGLLGDLKARLTELKQKREELDLQVTEYRKRLTELNRLDALYDRALTERASTKRQADEINRVLSALPTMKRLTALRDQFDALEIVCEPPASWSSELVEIRKGDIAVRVRLDEVGRSIQEVEKEITQTVDDRVALDLSARVADLTKTLEPRYLTALVDIPKLSGRIAELSVEALLLQLGKGDEKTPARLVLNAVTIGKFRALITERSGIDARLSSASQELIRAQRALEDEGENVTRFEEFQSPGRINAFKLLAATVRALPRSDDALAHRSLMRRCESVDVILSQNLAQLAPWRGTADELAMMAMPSPAKLDGWKSRYNEGRDWVKAAQADLGRLEPEVRRMDVEIDLLRARAGEIDEASVAASRAARETAWMSHRKTMDATSAAAFETAMRADDQLVTQRLIHFAEASKLAQLKLTRASVASDIEIARERLHAAERCLAEVRSEMSGALAAISFGASLDPAELEEWIRRRTIALRTREDRLAIGQEIADIRDRVEQSKKQLLSAMQGAGVAGNVGADLATLFSAAEQGLDLFNLAMDHGDRLRRLNEEITARTSARDDAMKTAREWDASWRELCDGCWIGEEQQVPDVGAVNGILQVLEKLATAVEARDGLVDRVQKMEKDRMSFEAAVELCDRLKVEHSGSPTELARIIAERVKVAERSQEQRHKLAKDLDRKRESERALVVERDIFDARMNEMTTFFGCANADEVEARISQFSKRQALQSSIVELEQALVEISRGKGIAEVEQQLALADREALEEQLEALAPALEDQDKTCHDLFYERSTAQKAIDAVGGDSAVAEIEEQRRTLLVEIEERAGRYLELRAGVTAAEQALKLYRDRHRSGMMTNASEAFRTISRGAYTGVAAQPSRDGEVLIAISAHGGSKSADELSKGARFQLYLALRVAGYFEFVANRPPIPFIADDIMETFDDFRAEETFRLFAQMAEHGQVIYLTHHRHLTEIARTVCPGVLLHDLDTIQSSFPVKAMAAE